MSALFLVINQGRYPGVGDVDDCAVIATFWASRASGFTGTLPTVAAFRAAAHRPDAPGPTGLLNVNVWDGVNGTALGELHPILWQRASWDAFATAVKGGQVASVGLESAKLPRPMRFGFMGSHRVGVAFENGWYLANPLAPDGSAPIPISEAFLRVAVLALGAGTVLAVTFPQQENPNMLAVTDAVPRTVDIPIGKQLFDLNGLLLDTNHVLRNDIPSPFASGAYRAVIVGLSTGPTLLLVKAVDVTDVRVAGDIKRNVVLTVDGRVLYGGSI